MKSLNIFGLILLVTANAANAQSLGDSTQYHKYLTYLMTTIQPGFYSDDRPFKKTAYDAKFLNNSTVSYESTVNEYLTFINTGKFGPWTKEEKCQVMELKAFSLSPHYYEGWAATNHYFNSDKSDWTNGDFVEANVDTMFMYTDSMKSFGCVPKFEDFAKVDKLRSYRENVKAESRKALAESDSIANDLKKHPTAQYLTSQAIAFKSNGDYEQALRCYKQAYKVAKTDEDKFGAYMSQIEMIDEKYLPDSAVRMWQRCTVNGYACRIKMEIGTLYFQAGKYEKALTAFKAALATNPEPLERNSVCEAMSDTYYKLGDIANGKKYYMMSL